jgi:hypothetical protein
VAFPRYLAVLRLTDAQDGNAVPAEQRIENPLGLRFVGDAR